jgi:hypothetical protein
MRTQIPNERMVLNGPLGPRALGPGPKIQRLAGGQHVSFFKALWAGPDQGRSLLYLWALWALSRGNSIISNQEFDSKLRLGGLANWSSEFVNS